MKCFDNPTKIKFDIGGGEIINESAFLYDYIDYYEIYFPNGSFDTYCHINTDKRCFQGID